jgi:heptaprenyl diphosphate synthase
VSGVVSKAQENGDLFGFIRGELLAVEKLMYRTLAVDNTVLLEACLHLLRAGGKRLRPALALLSARLGGDGAAAATGGEGDGAAAAGDGHAALAAGAGVELVHVATLIHDDMVDAASTRRGRPTVNARWSDRISVLAGDYLFACAFSLIATNLGRPALVYMSDVVSGMCHGELDEVTRPFDLTLGEDRYLLGIERKTAGLMAASCLLGALAADAPAERQERLQGFGRALGMTFQIVDDVLDIWGDPRAMGKPVGVDLRGGVVTLPVLRALAAAPGRDELREILGRAAAGDGDLDRALALVRASDAREYAQAAAGRYAARARQALAGLPSSPARETLARTVDFVLTRMN